MQDPEIYKIWTVDQANQNDCPKQTRKKCPIKIVQPATRANSATQGFSLWVCPCTLFLLIKTLLASLLSVFVEILFCKAKGPGPLSLTTGLVARICCFRHRHPAQSLAGNPGPAPRHCRSRPPEISTIRTVVLTLGSGTCQIPEAWGAGQLGGIWPLVWGQGYSRRQDSRGRMS